MWLDGDCQAKEEHEQRHGLAEAWVRLLEHEAGDTVGDRTKPGGREPCSMLARGWHSSSFRLRNQKFSFGPKPMKANAKVIII